MNREQLGRPGIQVLNRGGFANPDVLLVPTECGPVVVKDYALRSWPVRRWLAPALIRHESAMLRRAAGVPGVPGWTAPVDRLALAMQYIDGRSLRRRWHLRGLPPSFFVALEGILEGLAHRGLIHLDLRSPTNLLLSATGAPALVDLASAFALPVPDALRRGFERRALRKLRRRFGLSEPSSDGASPIAVEPSTESMCWEHENEGLDLIVQGVRWRRYEFGILEDPVPAVLLSDVGIGARIYSGVLAAAASRGRRAIAFDLPGSGGAGPARGRCTPRHLAAELLRLLETLRLNRVDLVGVGVGGLVARSLASAEPRIVRALVTLDAPLVRLSAPFRERLEQARRDPSGLVALLARSFPSRPPDLTVEAFEWDSGRRSSGEIARAVRALPVRSGASGALEIDSRKVPMPEVPWLALFSSEGDPGCEDVKRLPGVKGATELSGALDKPEALWRTLEQLVDGSGGG